MLSSNRPDRRKRFEWLLIDPHRLKHQQSGDGSWQCLDGVKMTAQIYIHVLKAHMTP